MGRGTFQANEVIKSTDKKTGNHCNEKLCDKKEGVDVWIPASSYTSSGYFFATPVLEFL